MNVLLSSTSVRLASLTLLAITFFFHPVQAQENSPECDEEFGGCLLCTQEIVTGIVCEVIVCEDHNHYSCTWIWW